EGADVQLAAQSASVVIGATIDVSGAAPDGQGGSLDIDAALDVTQNFPILAPGRGPEGCAGDMAIGAGGTITLGPMIDLSGGDCGGGTLLTLSVNGLTLRAGAEIDADGDQGPGGDVSFLGTTLNLAGNLHANGLNGGPGG